jgi:hypothetical protein
VRAQVMRAADAGLAACRNSDLQATSNVIDVYAIQLTIDLQIPEMLLSCPENQLRSACIGCMRGDTDGGCRWKHESISRHSYLGHRKKDRHKYVPIELKIHQGTDTLLSFTPHLEGVRRPGALLMHAHVDILAQRSLSSIDTPVTFCSISGLLCTRYLSECDGRSP